MGAVNGVVDEPVLVIDFGTSVSSAIIVDDAHSDREPLRQSTRSPSWWPSAVYVEDGKPLVGIDAKTFQMRSPWNYRDEFKRALRDATPMVLGGEEFAPVVLVTKVLEAFRQRAEVTHPRIHRTLLTVPPSYLELGDQRAELMIRAGHDAGFSTVELLPEPVAATLTKTTGPPLPGKGCVLVYDFGGGTFDAALVELGRDWEHQRIPAVSLERCGGRDIDASIAEWLLTSGSPKLAAELPEEVRTGADLSKINRMMLLAKCCDELKCDVRDGRRDGTAFYRDEIEVTLKRKRLDELAEPWVEMTVRCCKDLLRASGVEADSLGAVLLVGGSSQLALVDDRLKAEFGPDKIRHTEDAQLAVVSGAAKYVQRSGTRRVQSPAAADPSERPVRWPIPGGTGTLLSWRVKPGERYHPGAVLADVRLPLGVIISLRETEAGVVRQLHAGPNQTIRSDDWLLTVARPFKQWESGVHITDPAKVVPTSPVLWRGLVYTVTETDVVEARAAATGALRWRRYAGAKVTAPLSVAADGESDGRVYVGCKDGALRVLSAATGDPAGKAFRLPQAIVTATAEVGAAVCVSTADGYFNVFSRETRERVLAFTPPDGRGHGAGAPAALGTTVYFAVHHGPLYVVDVAALGSVPPGPVAKPRRVYGGAEASHDADVIQFAVAEGRLYVCCADDVIRRLDPVTGAVLSRFPPEQDQLADAEPAPRRRGKVFLQALQAQASQALPGQRPLFTTPLVPAGDTVYVGTRDGRIVALDAETLAFRADPRVTEGGVISDLAASGGLVYAVSGGELRAYDEAGLRAHAKAGLETATGVVPHRWMVSGVRSAPAVADGAAFLTSDIGRLRGLDVAVGWRSDREGPSDG